MALIKSISGIRGTIGGKVGENLTPLDIVKFASAYGSWLKSHNKLAKKVVIGRDGRISGEMVLHLVMYTLKGLGFQVINLDYSTTPTVEIAVQKESADGGIIVTASHNPAHWNALKLLNKQGEFLTDKDGKEVLEIAERADFEFAEVKDLGRIIKKEDYLEEHVRMVVEHPLVDVEAIKKKDFKVVVDPINSTGAIFVPALLKALGVDQITVINKEVTGKFEHNPEPLPENLSGLSNTVKKQNADLGISVDPDVDRLCFICEDGSPFGEEYTLVAVADYVLSKEKGNTVSNLSSTRALRDITEKHGGEYFPAPVGEVNVVQKMKAVNAVIGGEGNGGVIDPHLHYGRDALVGIGLFLTHLALSGKTISSLRNQYPNYYISKNKIELENGVDVQEIFKKIRKIYKDQPANTEDGLKIEFDKDWVHMRPSNTEPIIRIYAESQFKTTADNIARKIMKDIRECSNL